MLYARQAIFFFFLHKLANKGFHGRDQSVPECDESEKHLLIYFHSQQPYTCKILGFRSLAYRTFL